jgi:hypothetical protein
MNKLFLLLLFLFIFYGTQHSFAKEGFCHFTSTLETDDCLISFIECSGRKFVIKQIKDSSPDEQFLLVLDATGCFIAETSNIPMNKVTIIPSNISWLGKKILEFPATFHSLATGISTDKKCLYQNIDVHQRFRKENSPLWHRWGPLANRLNDKNYSEHGQTS